MRKASPLQRVLGRLEALDPVNLTNLVQRLARERSLLETVFDTIREGIVVTDRTGLIEYANAAALRLTGLRAEDVGRTTLWKFVPGLAQAVGEGGAALPEDGPAITREIQLAYPESRYVRLYMVPFREAGAGGEPRWAVILTDITGEKVAAEELIESEKLNSVFLLAAGVAHEIGNPLNSLDIHLQLMDRQARRLGSSAPAAKLHEAIGVCREEVRRLDGIIRNFLEAMRPRPPELRDVDMVPLVEEVLRFLARELENREIAIEVEATGQLPAIAGDRDQLKQVLFNLFRNAMEAMGPGGRLSVRVHADDANLHVHIADTGKGIRRDELARLFQAFQTTKPGGNGLGLVIVERIVRAHGGTVGVASQEAVGTVVSLAFPLKHRRVRLLRQDAGPVPSG
jgi:PAS domain S-box-containing protein